MEEQGKENRVIRSELPPVSQYFQNLYTICLAFVDFKKQNLLTKIKIEICVKLLFNYDYWKKES
jgi:hypothetical protein